MTQAVITQTRARGCRARAWRRAALGFAAGTLLALVAGAEARAQAPRPGARWRLAATAEGAFDSNPKFLADDRDEPGSASSRVGGLLERNWNLPRIRLLLRADASRLDYTRASELSRNTWGVEGQGLYAFSPRLSMSVDAAERSDASRDLRALTDTGFVLAQVRTRTRRGRADLAWRLSERVTAAVATRYERYSFDAADVVGGSTLEGAARVTASPWARTSLTLSADAQRQRRERVRDAAPLSDGSTLSLYASLTRGVPEHVEMSLTAGSTRLVPLGSTDARPTALLGGGLRARRGRHTLEARADRRASEAFGLGRSGVTLTLTASDGLALTPRLALALRGNWSRTTDPGDEAFELRARGGAAELAWRLAPRLRARGTYTYFRGDDRRSAPRTNHVAGLALAYEQAWK